MVAALNETLLEETRRAAVFADVRALIDAEVSDKKGASGIAVKSGYAAVKKVSPSIVGEAVEKLLPSFLDRLDPFWQEFRANGGRFADYLSARADDVSDALLGVFSTGREEGLQDHAAVGEEERHRGPTAPG